MAIMTAWCNLDSNSCTSDDIKYWRITNSALVSAFKTSFGMTNVNYWSSSPVDSQNAYILSVNSSQITLSAPG